jgi:hypothetical protein
VAFLRYLISHFVFVILSLFSVVFLLHKPSTRFFFGSHPLPTLLPFVLSSIEVFRETF